MTTSNKQQTHPQTGPIAQQLAKLQTNGHQLTRALAIAPKPTRKQFTWGISDKSAWDWVILVGTILSALGTIFIPIVVAVIGNSINEQIAQQQALLALDQQREQMLTAYLNDMRNLLLNNNLGEANSSDPVSQIARAETLTMIRKLDPLRRGTIVNFLYQTNLITFKSQGTLNDVIPPDVVIDLSQADLHDVDLASDTLGNTTIVPGPTKVNCIAIPITINDFPVESNQPQQWQVGDTSVTLLNGKSVQGIALGNTDLNNANLFDDQLNFADFHSAILEFANLGSSKLICADLTFSNLRGANLRQADLSGAYLTGADLSDTNITQQQLDQASSCQYAILPLGLVCHQNA